MVMTCILASSKPWYREMALAELEAALPEVTFMWAETPQQLSDLLLGGGSFRYIFFLHWHWLVPESVWKVYECVCFHMTDLPYGRGGSPLQNLISRGKVETRLSAIRMNEELDSGPVYTKRRLSLAGRAEDIYARAARLCFDIVRWMIHNQPVPEPQAGEPVYFDRRTPEQSLLPSQGTLNSVYDHIRMLDAPTYPHAFVEHGDFRLEFTDAEIQGGEIIARISIRKKPPETGEDA